MAIYYGILCELWIGIRNLIFKIILSTDPEMLWSSPLDGVLRPSVHDQI